jgi:hypothetical protein
MFEVGTLGTPARKSHTSTANVVPPHGTSAALKWARERKYTAPECALFTRKSFFSDYFF